MATLKHHFVDQPLIAGNVDPKDSRAKRLERQQSRFRDRGGIFVPSNRNTLLDVLLARTMSGDSPRTAAASNAARRRSLSSSPIRRPSHISSKTLTISRGRSSDVYTYDDITVASPSRLASVGKVVAGLRDSGRVDSKISQGASAKRRAKAKVSETEQSNIGADSSRRLSRHEASSVEHQPPTSRKPRPKAKASSHRSKAQLATILESENERDAAVEPPPRKKSKDPTKRSRSLPSETEVIEPKDAVEPSARKKSKGRPKRLASHIEATEVEEAVEPSARSSTSKRRGKGRAVLEEEPLDHDEEPAVPSKAKNSSRATPSKKGSKKKRTTTSKTSILLDLPVPLSPDLPVQSKSRSGDDRPSKKPPKSKKRQQEQEEGDTFEDPPPPRKRPKSQPVDVNGTTPKKKSAAIKDEHNAPSKKPERSKKRQQEEEDTFEDPHAPRKRPKSQPVDDNGAKPEKKSVAIKDEPKGKTTSSKVLKENTANKNVPLKVASKPAKTKKPVSKRQKSRHLPKVVLERIQRSLNQSHEVDDEPDPIDFLS